jgi:predicted membrane protein
MENNNKPKRFSRNVQVQLLIGIVLVFIGVAIIAEMAGAVPWSLRNIFISWQMLLIVLGIIFVAGKDSKSTGYILIAIGAFFILPKVFDLPYYWRSLFWPMMLILLGIIIIFHRGRRKGKIHHRSSSSSEDYLDDVAIFGGSDRILNSKNFQGGSITNIFGGSKYDLRNVQLAEGSNELDVTMIFGGSKFVVPEGWDIKIEVTSIFGGFSDKRERSIVVADPNRKLIIKGVTLFGGGELTNFG